MLFCRPSVFWIKNSKECKQFVQNRKDEINKLTHPEQWHYCETKKNPTDIGTKGQSAIIKLKENNLWLKGPEWLTLPPENWPEYVNKVAITPDEGILREIRGSKKDTQVLQVIVQRSRFNLETVIDIKIFSNFRRLLRVTVLCLHL